jgi:hypothetical protein
MSVNNYALFQDTCRKPQQVKVRDGGKADIGRIPKLLRHQLSGWVRD